MVKNMKIGEFARLCGISPRMVRFYEALGLLRPQRHANGYRAYRQIDVDFVKKVVLLNKAGVSLKDLALMSDCLYDEPQDFCMELKDRLGRQISAIDEQVDNLKLSKHLLEQLLSNQSL